MFRNSATGDDSSDKSKQIAGRADFYGFYGPSSPHSNPASPLPNRDVSTRSVNSIDSTGYPAYSPSTFGYEDPSVAASTYSQAPNMSSPSNASKRRSALAVLNPFKAKEALKDAEREKERLEVERIRLEKIHREERQHYDETLRRQATQLARERQDREEESKRRKEQDRILAEKLQADYDRRMADERNNFLKEQARKDELARQQRQTEIADERNKLLKEQAHRDELARQQRQAEIAAQALRDQKQKEREQRRRMEEERRRKLNTPAALKELRELIRQRYELDHEIWRLRDVRASNREVVEEKMEKSDALLEEILAIVGQWENMGDWTKSEWKMAADVKRRLEGGDKRWWRNDPPWESTTEQWNDSRPPWERDDSDEYDG